MLLLRLGLRLLWLRAFLRYSLLIEESRSRSSSRGDSWQTPRSSPTSSSSSLSRSSLGSVGLSIEWLFCSDSGNECCRLSALACFWLELDNVMLR